MNVSSVETSPAVDIQPTIAYTKVDAIRYAEKFFDFTQGLLDEIYENGKLRSGIEIIFALPSSLVADLHPVGTEFSKSIPFPCQFTIQVDGVGMIPREQERWEKCSCVYLSQFSCLLRVR